MKPVTALIAIAALTGCIPRAEPPPGYPSAARAPHYPDRSPPADAPVPRSAPPYRDQQVPYSTRPPRPKPRYPDQPPPEQPYPEDRPTRSFDTPPAPDRPVRAFQASPPAARPVWEARPVVADARVVPAQDYLVRPGDTLGRVSALTGAGAEAIARANGLASPFPLVAGRRLAIPGGRYHLVRSGESGIAIARAYGVPWSRVVDANALAEPFLLRAGQRVLIPDLTPDQPGLSTAAQRAAAFRLDIDDILTGGEPALAARERPVRPAPVAGPARVLPATAALAPPARLSGGFGWPVEGRLVSRFGPGQRGERQNGVTIAAPLGTPVRAAADGVVAYVGSGIASLGGLVIVKHGDGWTSVYGYAAKLLVRRGEAVRRGQPLALSGETGEAGRPAVHFELRRGRTPVNPQTQLPPI